jgi:hypothetical protein
MALLAVTADAVEVLHFFQAVRESARREIMVAMEISITVVVVVG